MNAVCPKGHNSTEDDFCSECGAKIAGANSGQSAGPSTSNGNCPDCQTPRSAEGGKFCEICGFNYQTGAHGEIPISPPSPSPSEAAPSGWTVLVTIDPTLKQEVSPDPPAEWQPLSIAAKGKMLLIGRTSQSRSITPEIALDFDSAVSHRHAILTCTDGSGWTIRDIGSSNGTRVNGKELEAMVDVALEPGDRITLGHWTCLTIAQG